MKDNELIKLASEIFTSTQFRELTYEQGPYDIDTPTLSLRRFVEAIEKRVAREILKEVDSLDTETDAEAISCGDICANTLRYRIRKKYGVTNG